MSFEWGDEYESNVVSNCCGARVYLVDICSDCKEHCEAVKEEEEEKEMTNKDTKGDKCGIYPIQIGGWPKSACNWHDHAYTQGSKQEELFERKVVDRQFLRQLLYLSKNNPLKILASYGMYAVARVFGSKWWEGK